jgi:hypothetical protein
MMGVIKDCCLVSYRDYLHFKHHPPPHWDNAGITEEMLQTFAQGGDHRRDSGLLHSLTIASNSCHKCNTATSTANSKKQGLNTGMHGQKGSRARGEEEEEEEEEEEAQDHIDNELTGNVYPMLFASEHGFNNSKQ